VNFNFKTAISSIAPTLATMLGGPLAGTAVTALESALGLTPGAGADGVTAAVAAGMTPETIAAVRAADQKHLEIVQQQGIDLDKLNIDFQTAMVAADNSDRASARDREVKVGGWTTPALAWTVVVAFAGVLALKLTGAIPVTDTATGDMITSLRDALMLVLAYYFGSSRGSQAKDATIANQAKAAAAP
jgi:hypothetical protein